MWPGIVNSNSVPEPAWLLILSCAPIFSAASRIPINPQWPSRPHWRNFSSIPRPVSRTARWKWRASELISTSTELAPECRNALLRASRPIRYAWSRIRGFNWIPDCRGRAAPAVLLKRNRVQNCRTPFRGWWRKGEVPAHDPGWAYGRQPRAHAGAAH
jgi:hypothetical protein